MVVASVASCQKSSGPGKNAAALRLDGLLGALVGDGLVWGVFGGAGAVVGFDPDYVEGDVGEHAGVGALALADSEGVGGL
jgi:hypothetical protein